MSWKLLSQSVYNGVGRNVNGEAIMRGAVILAAAVLVACAGQATADGKLVITKAVADSFESYKTSIGSVGSGVYAVTEDGQGGAGAGCSEANCQSRAADMAIQRCEAANPGRKCVVFARNSDPVVEYEVGQ